MDEVAGRMEPADREVLESLDPSDREVLLSCMSDSSNKKPQQREVVDLEPERATRLSGIREEDCRAVEGCRIYSVLRGILAESIAT